MRISIYHSKNGYTGQLKNERVYIGRTGAILYEITLPCRNYLQMARMVDDWVEDKKHMVANRQEIIQARY